jgi:hypothetical protein
MFDILGFPYTKLLNFNGFTPSGSAICSNSSNQTFARRRRRLKLSVNETFCPKSYAQTAPLEREYWDMFCCCYKEPAPMER